MSVFTLQRLSYDYKYLGELAVPFIHYWVIYTRHHYLLKYE